MSDRPVIPMPPWAYFAGAGLIVGFGAGWTVQGWRCDAARADALEKAVKQGAKQQRAVATSATTYEKERDDATIASRASSDAIRTVYRTISVPADCEPPADAQRLLERSIDRANTRASGEPGPTLPADSSETQPAGGPGAAGVGGTDNQPVRGLRFTPSPYG